MEAQEMTTPTDGRQLKAARIALGLTARELGKLAGLHWNTIAIVEDNEALPKFSYAADRAASALQGLGVIFIKGTDKAGVIFPAATERKPKKFRERSRTAETV